MSSGFRAMLGVAAGTFLIIVLAVAGAALGVAAFTGVQGPWPDGPVAQALAAFSRNGTLTVVAVVLLVIVGCLPGIGPRAWASLNPIVRRTSGVRGITVSDLLDISVARAVGFVAAVGVLVWAAPYAALDGPVTTAPVAALPAPAAAVTALAALVLLSLPYAIAGLFSLRRESEFVDDYRIRPYEASEPDGDDWRHLRERESGARRSRSARPVPATPIIEPLFPAGVVPATAEPAPEAAPEPIAAPLEPAVVVAARIDPGADPQPPSDDPDPELTSPAPVVVAPPSPPSVGPAVPVQPTEPRREEPSPVASSVGLADPDEPVLVFSVAADPSDPVMVFSPASGVEPRIAPPARRARPAYTPASRVKADELLAPPAVYRERRVAAPGPASGGSPDESAPASPSSTASSSPPKKRKKKHKGKKKKNGQSPVNVTVHVHMPPSA